MKPVLPGRGVVIAMSLKELFERGTIDEMTDFRWSIINSKPSDQRRLLKEVIRISEEISKADIITHSNDDVINLCRHIAMVCGKLPMRD